MRISECAAVLVCVVACRATPVSTPPASEPAPPVEEEPQRDRTSVASEPSPARNIGSGPEVCPMHLNGPVPDDAVNEWIGWTPRLLHLCQGEPDERSDTTWIYNLPDGCSEEESKVTVVFTEGVVTSAKVDTRHTGKICR